jgi:hypothetical protein
MPVDPPRQARLFSFATGRPIDDPQAHSDALAMLSRIAGQAMTAAADPSVVPRPDYDLLVLSDAIILLARQRDAAEATWRSSLPAPPGDAAGLYEKFMSSQRALRGPLVRLGRLRASTAAGIFAKAVVVRKAGTSSAAVLGKSLAEDLLNCADLREAIWPASAD